MVLCDRRNTFATSAWTSRAHAAQKHWKMQKNVRLQYRFMVRKNGHENAPLQVDGAQTKQTKKDKPTNKQTDVFHVFLCRTLFISINLIVLSWRHSEVGWICGNKQTWNLGAAFPSHQTKNEVRRLFQRYLVFTLIWGNDPIWREYFADGLVQPPTRECFGVNIWWYLQGPPPQKKKALKYPTQIFVDWEIGLFKCFVWSLTASNKHEFCETAFLCLTEACWNSHGVHEGQQISGYSWDCCQSRWNPNLKFLNTFSSNKKTPIAWSCVIWESLITKNPPLPQGVGCNLTS